MLMFSFKDAISNNFHFKHQSSKHFMMEISKMIMAPSLILAIIIIILCYVWNKVSRPKNFPPGPPRLPLIGSLLFMLSIDIPRPHLLLLRLSKKYGNVSSFFLGPRPCVLVNGFELIRHVLGREDCSFRPKAPFLLERSFNRKESLGLFFADGSFWKEQRRFTLRHLRDFGFGKRSMEGLIEDELEALISDLTERNNNTPNRSTHGINLMDLFPLSVVNILWAMMAGVRYDHKNEKFRKLCFLTWQYFRYSDTTGGPSATYAWLRFVPIFNHSYKKQINSDRALQNFIRETIDEHVTTYQEDNMRDFIDVFLREMKAQADNLDTTFTEEQLIVLCVDMFLAGTETTSTTLSYLILYLIVYPEWQVKVRDEINKVVGSRLPSALDIPELHITQSVMQEVARHAGNTLLMYHSNDRDIELCGYSIPKGTTLVLNMYSITKDRSFWGDPAIFMPERFLDKKGHFMPSERVMPFGYGPRVCPGRTLARDTTVIFLANLLQRFTFSIPSGCAQPSMDHLPGFATTPRPFTVYMQELE